MHIKSIRAKNFFAIGEEPVSIDFTKYGNIILLKGKNYDVNDDNEPRSNGSGKSTITEAITYALYGKTIRNLSHSDIVNKKTKKGLEVEIYFNDYRVVRTRKPDSLRIWKSDKELTLGGIPATQELLENVIKLSYNAFINIVCFGQHNTSDFLSCPPSSKRKIVENLLSLEKYEKFQSMVKEEQKAISSKIRDQKVYYENLTRHETSYEMKLSSLNEQESVWIDKKQTELNELEKLLSIKKNQLSNTDTGNKILLYESSQVQIKEHSTTITTLELNKDKIANANSLIYEKLDVLKNEENNINSKIASIENEINTDKISIKRFNYENNLLNNLTDGATCSVCFGKVTKENYLKVLEYNNQNISSMSSNIETLQSELNNFKQQRQKIKENIQRVLDKQNEIKTKTKTIDIKIINLRQKIRELMCIENPDTDNENRILQEQLSSIEEKIYVIKHELNEGNPYKSIIKTIEKELKEYQKEISLVKHHINEMSNELPYYDFWVDGFSETGIRRLVIDDIVPSLNDRVNYYLHYLLNNKIKVSFDNDLNEILNRNPPDGDPFVYNALSGAEKKSIDFAISQAFSFVMSVSAGNFPSILLLDEIGAFIDQDGMQGIFSLIQELSKDKQVIVVTHDQILLDMLQNSETITIIKKDGFSYLGE